jgi:predicted Zn finger-like uncharacterized protein
MAILITCNQCHRRLQVTQSQIGHIVRCPSCGVRWKAEMPPKESVTPKVKKCLRCGQPLEKKTGNCRHCPPAKQAGVGHGPEATDQPQREDDGAEEEDSGDATTALPFWNRPLFALSGGMVPEVLLLVLGWSCTALELVLQWQGAAAMTLNSPGVLGITVMVLLMLVIWVGNTMRKLAFEGEFSSADLGSLFLVVAATSALFWAHHMRYHDANGRDAFLPPFVILIASLTLQVVATWIMLRPWFQQK